jgi:hypothetical protein
MSPRPAFHRPGRPIGRPTLFPLVLLILAVTSFHAFGQDCTPAVPCADKRGCPDLTIDPMWLAEVLIQVKTFSDTDCAVVEGDAEPGTRTLLLFSTFTPNLGPGDLVLGNPQDHPDWFELVTCHGHAHLKDYAAFRLWTPKGYASWQALRAANPGACSATILSAHPELKAQLMSASKHAFCVEDFMTMKSNSSLTCPSHGSNSMVFGCDYQGISTCWADLYNAGLEGQWIDITSVKDGQYFLENEVNDTHFMTETDYTNNSAAITVQITGGTVQVVP